MDYTTVVMLVLMIAIFYFLLIRPENKRKKKAEEMRNSLKKGDKITTIGGIVGTVVQVTDQTIILETSDDRVRVELTKWAVQNTGVQATQDEQSGRGKKKSEDKELPAEEKAAGDAEPSESEKKD